MNLKNSRFMNRLGYIFAAAMMMLGLTAAGQISNLDNLHYDRVYRNNFWNESRNVTGIRQYKISSSFAEVYARYSGGDFRDTWQPEESWSAGAATASFQHLKKISFAGSFTFDQTENYRMCGSMFIKPGLYPVDVLEFTPGRKTLQTYSFDGGVSYDVAPSWRIGAKMDFESANIAKRKDLRHSNKRLEMSVTPSFMYHKEDFAVGASYIFEKTSEAIEAEQVGTSESSYWAFLDKGLMYGAYSVWTGSGIHLDENGVNGFPVNDFSNGIAVQAQYKDFFGEITYLNTQGRIGEKEYMWFRFPGNRIDVLLGYSHESWNVRHNARMKFGWNRLGLDENVLEKVTVNGVNSVLEHGSNRILSREVISFTPEYEAMNKYLEFTAWGDFKWTNSLSSQMYPYVYGQKLFTYSAGIGFLMKALALELGFRLGVGGGKVDESQRLVDNESGAGGEPFRLQEWYQKSIDYQTSSKQLASVVLRYRFKNGLYLEGNIDVLTKGLNKKDAPDHADARLKFGYNF